MLFFSVLRDPNGIRTRVTAVKGRRPRPLDDGAMCFQAHNYRRSSVLHGFTQLQIPALEPFTAHAIVCRNRPRAPIENARRAALDATAHLPYPPNSFKLSMNLIRFGGLCSVARA